MGVLRRRRDASRQGGPKRKGNADLAGKPTKIVYLAYSVCTKNRRYPSIAAYVQTEAILRHALTMSWCLKPCDLPTYSARRFCARMSLDSLAWIESTGPLQSMR